MSAQRAIMVIAVLLTAIPLKGPGAQQRQFRIIPKESLDSLANPVAIAGSPMRFGQTKVDAGTIGEDDAPSEYIFRWRNEGDTPLVVTEVKTGCGCASAKYDRKPVKAGEEGQIIVTYRPKGHPGWFRRRITVFTQLEGGPSAVLELSGYVTPSVKPTYEYPYAMGSLRLKQNSVRMSGTERSIESIEVLNAGDKPLTIKADGRMLPPGVTVRVIPETVEPAAKGDIEVAFDPAKFGSNVPKQLPIILEGAGELPPRQRTIYLKFETEQ